MAKFYFTQSVKCTIWRNYDIEIEAESEEEARKIAIDRFGENEADLDTKDEQCDVVSTDLLYDSEELIPSPKENGDASTIYLYEDLSIEPFYMNGEC